MFKRGLHYFAAIVTTMVLLLGWAPRARAFVFETSHLATCSAFGLWGTTDAPYVRVMVYNAQTDTNLLDQTMPTPGNGTLSVEVNFAPQTEGTILYYFVYGLNSSNPNDFDGEYHYELNDGYPCAGQGTPPEQLFASTTSHQNKCGSFAATGVTNAPYIGVEVKTTTGTVLYRSKLPTSAGSFAFNLIFSMQKKGKVLDYRVWPSASSLVTPYDGSNGYFERVACKS